MSKSTSTKTVSATKTATKTATATANVLAQANNAPVQAAPQAAPLAKVPASMAVAASIAAAPTVAAGTLPTNAAAFAGYTVQLTAKGAAAKALQGRMLPTAKHGPCPFAVALFNGQGKTLAQAWSKVTASGHGQQGRGQGGYTAAQAINYYTKTTGWFLLVAPSK